jgi:hypothetical protein
MRIEHAPFHKWWIWMVYLILLLIGVPWYWQADNTIMMFGMPGWALIAILTSVTVSCITSFLWFAGWQDEDENGGSHE